MLPHRFLCDSIINEYLKLIDTPRCRVLPFDFVSVLVSSGPRNAFDWAVKKKIKRNPGTGIIVTLHEGSTHHWAVAIIRYGSRVIDVDNIRPHNQRFKGLFARLLRFPNMLHFRFGAGWRQQHYINVETKDCFLQVREIDSPVIMCYHVHMLSRKLAPGIIPKATEYELRKAICDSIVDRRVLDLDILHIYPICTE